MSRCVGINLTHGIGTEAGRGGGNINPLSDARVGNCVAFDRRAPSSKVAAEVIPSGDPGVENVLDMKVGFVRVEKLIRIIHQRSQPKASPDVARIPRLCTRIQARSSKNQPAHFPTYPRWWFPTFTNLEDILKMLPRMIDNKRQAVIASRVTC